MSITIVTRAGKGAPLNATEHDANINNIVAAIENTTIGHDHDGANSKKITYSSITAMTSAQLAGIISDETGSGALVFAESPTLVTPTLGVATATSINKVAITAPATSATLTISDGVTATIAAELHVEAATHVNQDLTSDASPTFAGVTITGPAALGYSTITSSGTAAEYTTYFLDATSGEVILTLPAAATYAKRIYHIVRVQAAPSAYNCIVACQSGEYINGVGSAALENNYDRITVQSNGTGWIIIGR